jgi:hypothetical protein
LGQVEHREPDAVGGHLRQILKEGDPPDQECGDIPGPVV